jgi:hypothetical protein
LGMCVLQLLLLLLVSAFTNETQISSPATRTNVRVAWKFIPIFVVLKESKAEGSHSLHFVSTSERFRNSSCANLWQPCITVNIL